jgi:hypothetical protein
MAVLDGASPRGKGPDKRYPSLDSLAVGAGSSDNMILDYFPLVICPNQERDFKFLV